MCEGWGDEEWSDVGIYVWVTDDSLLVTICELEPRTYKV